MLPLAHAGHWLFWILYGVPVVIVLAAVAQSVVRDRRARRADAGARPDAG